MSLRATRRCAAAVAVLLAGGCTWLAHRDPAEAALPAAPATGAAVEMLGINEAVSVPPRIEQRLRPDRAALERRVAEDARAARRVGARWDRGNSATWPRLNQQRWEREGRSFERSDLWVRVNQQAGLEMLVVIGPWPGNRTSQATSRYEPRDMGSYLSFVRQVVERYDGDGVDDMPGLAGPVRWWEVDNEPDLKDNDGPRGRRSNGFCTPETYARVLLATAGAIREADPGAHVLNGGIYRPAAEPATSWMRRLFALPGVLDAIDAVSVHAYHDGPGVERFERVVALAREVAPGKPVWVTETSVPSNGRKPWEDEAWQGRIVARTLVAALGLGVEKVFWHTLYDPPSTRHPVGGMFSNSLFQRSPDERGLREKPAALAWRAMARLLEGVDRASVQPVEVEGGLGVALGGGRWIAAGDGRLRVHAPATSARLVVGGAAVPLDRRGEAAVVDGSGGAVLLSR